MQEIIARDSYGNSLTCLVQWDEDVYVYLSEDGIDSAYKVHFFNNKSDKALVVESEYKSGILKAKIPNTLLTNPYIICGYVNVVKDGETKSLYGFKINVRQRPAPSDKVYVGTKDWIDVQEIIDECREYAKNASDSASNAKKSETNAAASEKASATSATNAKNSETAAATSEKNAKSSETASAKSATSALQSENNAKTSANNAENSASESEDYSLLSKSYAIGEGNKRSNEATDNSKYYCEQSKKHADSIQNMSRWTNTIIDDITRKSYFIGIENGVVYICDEFE